MPPKIFEAERSEHYEAVRSLFEQYAASLGFDLSFQGFREELRALPGEYAPPGGALLLAEREGRPVGCIALRRVDAATCEMKRLYVAPAERGTRLGRALATTLIDLARGRGYARMRLDTVPAMREAKHLYESLGFREIEPYRYNPVEGATFMELVL